MLPKKKKEKEHLIVNIEDQVQRLGLSKVVVFENAKLRRELINDTETMRKTKDFIFGKSEENPFSDITKELNDSLATIEASYVAFETKALRVKSPTMR